MTENSPKSVAKNVVKKGLLTGKKLLSKNRYSKKVGSGLRNVLFPPANQNIYDASRYGPSIHDYYTQSHDYKDFKRQPLISVVMPTYNTPESFLRECLESVIIQSYPNWELCIADDASTDKQVAETIKEYAKKDKRIKYNIRTKNGHISAATNSAIDLAKGDYIALLDHDDVLWPNALYEVVKVINQHDHVDLIYTDEDKIDSASDIHSFPFFKPDWSPEFLESCNYITHFSVIKATVLKAVGGFRVGYEGAQDWDLFLRVTGETQNIHHIPKVLYSWRVHEASTASDTDAKPYVYEAQRKTLEDHVATSGFKGTVSPGIIKQHSVIQYDIIDNPQVAVLLCCDKEQASQRCLDALVKHNSYQHTSYVLVLGSKSGSSVRAWAQSTAKRHDAISFFQGSGSAPQEAINEAAKQADADYLVIVDEHIILSTKAWVERMLGDAQRRGVGAVGAKLVDKTKQKYLHAGIGLGIDSTLGDLLYEVGLDDIHYMRGLYGQSRRNASATRSLYMLKKTYFEEVGGLQAAFQDRRLADVDLCLKLIDKGRRIVYSPYVTGVDVYDQHIRFGHKLVKEDKQRFVQKWKKYITYDPYFNPNFTRVGSHLNID